MVGVLLFPILTKVRYNLSSRINRAVILVGSVILSMLAYWKMKQSQLLLKNMFKLKEHQLLQQMALSNIATTLKIYNINGRKNRFSDSAASGWKLPHYMCGSRGGGGGGGGGTGGPDPPLKNHKIIGFSSNTGPDLLKKCWAIIGTPAKHHLMVFRWWADDGPIIVVLGSSLPSSTKKNKIKNLQSWTPSDKTFWIHACIMQK